MPQYYSILDNGQGKAKGKAMPRRNQNRTYGTKKVNWRMREGSNYYGDVTAAKKRKAPSRSADSYGRGARSSGRSADSYGRGNTSRGYLTAETSRQTRKAPNKNYSKGRYR